MFIVTPSSRFESDLVSYLDIQHSVESDFSAEVKGRMLVLNGSSGSLDPLHHTLPDHVKARRPVDVDIVAFVHISAIYDGRYTGASNPYRYIPFARIRVYNAKTSKLYKDFDMLGSEPPFQLSRHIRPGENASDKFGDVYLGHLGWRPLRNALVDIAESGDIDPSGEYVKMLRHGTVY